MKIYKKMNNKYIQIYITDYTIIDEPALLFNATD